MAFAYIVPGWRGWIFKYIPGKLFLAVILSIQVRRWLPYRAVLKKKKRITSNME
jgi:hypothetical protein